MQGILKSVIVMAGAAALSAPALAQQGAPPAPPPGAGQGGPPPGAPQGARPGGPGGAGAPGGAPGGGAARPRPAPPPPNTGVPISAALMGHGTGYAGMVIDPPAGTICYILNATTYDPPTMAHIHVGKAGETGNPVVTLGNPLAGSSGGCAPIAANLSQAILANPAGYYVNIHTATQPQGAIRGQLSK